MVHKTKIAPVSQGGGRESAQCTFMTRVARLPLDSDEIGVRRTERRCPTQFLPRGNDEIIYKKVACILHRQYNVRNALVFPCTLYIPPCLSPKL